MEHLYVVYQKLTSEGGILVDTEIKKIFCPYKLNSNASNFSCQYIAPMEHLFIVTPEGYNIGRNMNPYYNKPQRGEI